MNCIKEIKLKDYPKNNTPIINVLDNGISYLLIDKWPMEQGYFSDEEINHFEQKLSEIVGAKVVQEDRDRFTILTNDLEKITQLQIYLEEKAKDFLLGKTPASSVRINLRAKEINALIQEKTTNFFQKEGLKYVKKDLAYVLNTKEYRAEYGFAFLEYHPQYQYRIVLFIQLKEVEKIYNKIDGATILAPTYVFPLSYFLDKDNYINNNPQWLIQGKQGIEPFAEALKENYTKYVKDFIPFISQPQNMLNFLLNEVATGKKYALRENNFMRILILMKLLDYPMAEVEAKAREFKTYYKEDDKDIIEEAYQQMDAVVSGAW